PTSPSLPRDEFTCPLLFGTVATRQTADALRARVLALNAVLKQECEALPNHLCTYDQGATYDAWNTIKDGDTATALAMTSTVDHFHPSLVGQQKIADVTWKYDPLGQPINKA